LAKASLRSAMIESKQSRYPTTTQPKLLQLNRHPTLSLVAWLANPEQGLTLSN
jgi:hypothetical protein